MISKNKATRLMMEYDSLSFSRFSEVDLAITMSASTGNQSVSFFYIAKTASKLKTLLRTKGYYVETVTFKSFQGEELITVWWDTSMLESHSTSKEVK